MKAVVQRVKKASVTVNEKITGKIEEGVLILLGIIPEDTEEDINWLVGKICRLRIFNDSQGVMNLSLKDINGRALVVSQFTLHASIKKGNRPYYGNAAGPETAIPLYEKFLNVMKKELGTEPAAGIFGADMKVNLLNDGPVTIIMDSKKIE